MFPHFLRKRPNSQRELKRAYRELAKELHPDVDGGSKTEFQSLQIEFEQIRDILDSGKTIDWTGTDDPNDVGEPEWFDEPEQWVSVRMRPNPDPTPTAVAGRNFPWGCVALMLVFGVGVLFAYSAVQGGYALTVFVVLLMTVAIATFVEMRHG